MVTRLAMAVAYLLLLFLFIHPSLCTSSPCNDSQPAVLTPGSHVLTCRDSSSSAPASPCVRSLHPAYLNDDEVGELLDLATSAFSLTPGGSGAVTIVDMASGALSYRDRFINIFSLFAASTPPSFFPLPALSAYLQLTARVRLLIAETLQLPASSLFLTRPSFFSRIEGGKEAVSANDEYWHSHVDREQYGSFDITALLYLSNAETDFTGGEFLFTQDADADTAAQQQTAGRQAAVEVDAAERHVVQQETETQAVCEHGDSGAAHQYAVKPAAGTLLFFTSGNENVHYVRQVRSGVRYALTIAFTRRLEDSVEQAMSERYDQRIADWRQQQQLQHSPEPA